MIEVPSTEDSIDTKYLEAFLKDEQEKLTPLFELYCTQKIPISLACIKRRWFR